ncbi:MAG: 50S ribosomal protein L10 [Candidatus Omnitrophica bacterium]|nr:50S ribosomal protein L10 [Candidatus Omnitrophota bacterium]
MPSVVNKVMMREIENQFEENAFAFFSSFDKLSVAAISELRNKLSKTGTRSMVIKHALAKKVLKARKADAADKFFKGFVFVTFGSNDPQIVSKALLEFSKTNNRFISSGVYFERKIHDQDFVKQLASLPSRKELLTQVVLRIKSPITGIVLTLHQVLRGFVVALNEVKKLKEAQGQTA